MDGCLLLVSSAKELFREKNVWLRWYRLLSPHLDRSGYMHSTLLHQVILPHPTASICLCGRSESCSHGGH